MGHTRFEEQRIRETWLAEGDHLVGAGLSLNGEGSLSWEHLRIAPIDGKLTYVASPSGQERTLFPMTSASDTEVVFENPGHDFPQRIRYTRAAPGLAVRVESRDGEDWKGFGLSYEPCGQEVRLEELPDPRPPQAPGAPVCSADDPRLRSALRDYAKADQKERKKRDYEGMAERDAVRLVAVAELVAVGAICGVDDAYNAGVVLQHSSESAEHRLAWGLFSWACAEGREDACSWATLAWDRHLVSAGHPQWYGTQFQGQLDPDTGEHLGMCLVALDGRATDQERTAMGRGTLVEVMSSTYRRNDREPPSEPTYEQLMEDGLVCEPKPW